VDTMHITAIRPRCPGQLRPKTDHLRLVMPRGDAPRCAGLSMLGNTLLDLPWIAWAALDALIVTFSIYVSYSAVAGTSLASGFALSRGWLALVQAGAFLLAGLVFGLYEQQTLLRRSRILTRTVLGSLCAVAIASIGVHLTGGSALDSRLLLLSAALYLSLALPTRLLACWCINGHSRRFLIVGTDRRSRLSLANPDAHHCDGLSRRYQLVGYVSTDGIEVGHAIDGHPVLGTIEDIASLCLENDVQEVVVGPGPAKNQHVLDHMLGCLTLGCRVTDLCTFYEQVMSEVPVASLDPSWFLLADLKHTREAQLIAKRAFDLVGASVGLILSVALWPIIALAIKLDSRGPVFYSQRRIGLNGQLFRLHKFRTMHVEAEKDGHRWASIDDPRVTRVGRYLRKSRLDELPQLWNVLCGHMALVGPRPERPEFVEELAGQIRFYNERHLIKPGLTGWAQIHYHYGASVQDSRRKLQLDLWYMKHMSLELDVIILLRTLGTLLNGGR